MPRIWKYYMLSTALSVVAAASGLGLVFHSRAVGRREAIDRYRQECVGADKSAHRGEFTLLYVDEYRAGNCEEAIRMIWGEQ